MPPRFRDPLPGAPVTGRFGECRRVGDNPCGRRHAGIDKPAPLGTPIVAAADGVVVASGQSPGVGGIRVILLHAGGWTTGYYHLPADADRVRIGDTVKAGDQIGVVGDTGNARAPHLHFEARRAGAAVDPVPLFGDVAAVGTPGDPVGAIVAGTTGRAAGGFLAGLDAMLAGIGAAASDWRERMDNFDQLSCEEVERWVLTLGRGEELSTEELLAVLMGIRPGSFGPDDLGDIRDWQANPENAERYRRIRNKVVECGLAEKGLIAAITEPITAIAGIIGKVFSVGTWLRVAYAAGAVLVGYQSIRVLVRETGGAPGDWLRNLDRAARR